MKKAEMARLGLYAGIGAGLVLFALTGVLPGSFIGGVVGLKVVHAVTGGPLGGELIPRMIIAVSMVTGMIASALTCIMGPGVAGWALGYFIDSVQAGAETTRHETLAAENK